MLKILQCVFLLVFVSIITNAQISGIINTYQKVNHYDFCKNSVTVNNATGFNVGDKVLLIQMRGAEIDTANTSAYGTILNYANAGNYEFGIISNVVSNQIFLRDSVQRTYNDSGYIQIVKVPIYTNVTVTDTLKCKAWDGESGGILVFEVNGTLTLNAPIDVRDRGFRGGEKFFVSSLCGIPQVDYVCGSMNLRIKGEGIVSVPIMYWGGTGPLANGGGAGGGQKVIAGHNDAFYLGGGGGGNYGAGGQGGKSTTVCTPQYNGGLGGKLLNYSTIANKIFMAGGGGVGHHRYSTTGPEFGTNGGGIVIIKANSVSCNNQSIYAYAYDKTGNYNNVGRSGGGAGGTVVMEVQSYTGNLTVDVHGGKGGDNNGGQYVGPGGGGGGGIVWVNQTTFPSNITTIVNGGLNGMQTTQNSPWGATAGQAGGTLTGLALLQTSNAVFVPVSATTNIVTNSPICVGDTLQLSTGPVPPSVQYQWNGPNGFTSNLQNPTIDSVITANSGTYLLEIIVQGCPGPVATSQVYVGAFPLPPVTTSDTICFGANNPVLSATGNNVNWYSNPQMTTLVASDTNNYKPIATSVGTHTFYVTDADSICVSAPAISVLEILPTPPAPQVNNQTVCFGSPVAPFTVSANGLVNWYSDSLLTNLIHTGASFTSPATSSGIYYYYVNVYDTNYLCTSQYRQVVLYIVPIAYAIASNDTNICKTDTATLSVNASFNSAFLWSTGDTTQQINVCPGVPQATYTVTVNNGCGTAVDSVKVTITPLAPSTTNDTVCFGNPNPPLTSSGTDVKWYADYQLTNYLASGSSFIPTATSVGAHTYYATQTVNNCESFPTPAILVVLPSPAQPVVNNQTVCIGDTVYPFIASGNGIINWYLDSLLSNLIHTGDTLISTETNAGIYHYYATVFDTVYLCTSSVKDVVLMIVPQPFAIASNDTTVCKGEFAFPSVTGSINSTFTWSTGDTTQQISVNPQADTEYFITVSNGCFTPAVDSVIVHIWPLPLAFAGLDTAICLGDTITLTATGGVQYQWNNGLGNTAQVSVHPISNTNYVVTVTDVNGCSKSDDVNVTIWLLPVVTINGDTLICEGNSTQLTASGGISYLWSTSATTATITVAPVTNQTYTVLATDANTCSNTASFTLQVHNTYYVSLTSDFAPLHEITQGQVITFTATPDTYPRYDFFINSTLKQSGASNIFSSAAIEATSIVSVIAYEFGCPSVEEDINVKVKVLPNAFTPFDGDGINDIFGKDLDVTILNRWGEEIYKGVEGWDGKYKNSNVSPGTYYFIVEMNKGTSNAQILTGTINVVIK